MVAIHSSKMLVTTYWTTWHHNQEGHNPHIHCSENLKSHVTITSAFLYKERSGTLTLHLTILTYFKEKVPALSTGAHHHK
jgi:hypothetical protein